MLDLKTIFIYSAVLNLSIVLVTTIAWWRSPSQKDVLFWFLAGWFIVLGGLFMSSPELLPYNIMEYIGGMLYVASTGMIRLGFKDFHGHRYRLSEAFVAAGITGLALMLARLLDDPMPVRVAVIYAGSSINLALTAKVLWRGTSGEKLPSRSLAVLVFTAYSLANAAIVPAAIVYPITFVDRVPVSDWFGYSSVLLVLFNMASFLIAVVLKLERASDTQRQLAEQDALTGIANRRLFIQQAGLLSRTPPATVAILDLDHFKHINDTFGHAGGDDALVQFADLVQRLLPDDAVFGRLGGEEFGICLPGCDQASAMVVLDDVRKAVDALEIVSGVRRFRLTVSCGYAVMNDPARTLDTWLAEADCGLYAAKHAGRNRVIAHSGAPGREQPDEPAADHRQMVLAG